LLESAGRRNNPTRWKDGWHFGRFPSFHAGVKAGGCRSDHVQFPENFFKFWEDMGRTRVLWFRSDPVPRFTFGSSMPSFHVCNPAGLDGSSMTLLVDPLGFFIGHRVSKNQANKRIGKAIPSNSRPFCWTATKLMKGSRDAYGERLLPGRAGRADLAAFWIMVFHLFSPWILIPALSAGVSPPRP